MLGSPLSWGERDGGEANRWGMANFVKWCSIAGYKSKQKLLHPHQQIGLHHFRCFPEQRLDLLEESVVFRIGDVGLEVSISIPAFHGGKLARVFTITDEVKEETSLLPATIGGVLSENGREIIGVVKFKFGDEVQLL
jgi:hypothetical protein